MNVRRLNIADATAFRALRLRCLKAHPDAFTSSYEEDVLQTVEVVEQRLADASGNTFWGAFQDGELQGIIGLTREARAKNRHKGHVIAMFVAPESRRHGFGRALLRAVIDHARDAINLEQLVLTVTSTNAAAIALYRTTGFGTFGVEPRAIQVDGEYFDKEHMILFL
jgi:ribosomal protein S18 acetylase RimI-like enzyme